MKTTVNSKSLATALTKLPPAIQAKATLPIMECVRIVVDGARMTISATNLDMMLSAVVECETKKNGNGSCCIAFGKLNKAVNEIGGVLELAHKDGKLTVKSTTRKASVSYLTEESDKWPEMEGVSELPEPEDIDLLASSLQSIQHAACEEENRYVMCSVYFDGDNLVSTDGNRFACAKVKSKVQAVVPIKLVRALLKSKPGTIAVSNTEKLIQFDCGDFNVVGKICETPYPSWQSAVQELAESIEFNRDELLSVIRQGGLSDEVVKFTCGSDKIICESANGVEASSCETSAKGVFEGEFRCKSELISQSLSSCDNEVIRIGLSAGDPPFRKQIRIESGNCYYVIMQRRPKVDPVPASSGEVASE